MTNVPLLILDGWLCGHLRCNGQWDEDITSSVPFCIFAQKAFTRPDHLFFKPTLVQGTTAVKARGLQYRGVTFDVQYDAHSITFALAAPTELRAAAGNAIASGHNVGQVMRITDQRTGESRDLTMFMLNREMAAAPMQPASVRWPLLPTSTGFTACVLA